MRRLFLVLFALASCASCALCNSDQLAALKKRNASGTYGYARYSSGLGKGSATVKCAVPVTATSTLDEVVIDFKEDAAGIAPGGRVVIIFPADCTSPQMEDQSKLGFLRIDSGTLSVESSIDLIYFSKTNLTYAASAHKKMLVIKLPNGLPKDGKITVIWTKVEITKQARGWNAGRVTFAVYVDHDADGWEEEIAFSPWIAVTPLDADQLVPIIRSTAVVGEPVRCVVRALDKLTNPAIGYRGEVSFESTDPGAKLPAPYRFGWLDASSKTFDFVFTTPGFHWITVIDETGHRVESNPVEVFEKKPPYSLYWGDLHVHTRMSADASSWVPA